MTTAIPVLLYHSVNDHAEPRDRRWTVSPVAFASHVDAIAASGRTPLLITELAEALRGERPLPPRPLAITFDDGFADTYDAVAALSARGLSATVYVTSGEVGTATRLDAHGVVELARMPSVEIGAHAVRHRHLDELDPRTADREVRHSKAQLEDMLGAGVDSFAYPHGAYDRNVRAAVVSAGYSSAAAVKNSLSHERDDPFAIARWTVTAGTEARRIAGVLEGDGVACAWSGERLRTRAYRAVRRSRRRVAEAVGSAR
jgi:peptidoglycan/xylan/chitin deacetylase (PgdA/CDA1 family)